MVRRRQVQTLCSLPKHGAYERHRSETKQSPRPFSQSQYRKALTHNKMLSASSDNVCQLLISALYTKQHNIDRKMSKCKNTAF